LQSPLVVKRIFIEADQSKEIFHAFTKISDIEIIDIMQLLVYSKRIFLSSILCLLISGLSEFEKRKMSNDENHIPFCDSILGENYKCSIVLKSEYSTGFGFNFLPDALKISNSLYGIFFYAIIASLSKKNLYFDL
jgi:uncharacterized membrane protein